MTARPEWFAHANVNCSDLVASEQFSVDGLELDARWRTEPSHVQDGAGFGMPGSPVQWEGAILTDRRGLRGPAVDLLRWIAPATRAGVYRVALTVDDIDVAYSDLRRALPDGCVVELLEHGLR